MKVNKWTLGLAAVGLVSLPAIVQAEEKMSPVQTALASTIISGYVNTAMQWDFGTGNAYPPGYIYNSGKQDGFSLNSVKLSIEKPLDEAKWSAGYKADLMFGPDANTFATTSSGVNTSDFAIRQAYVALRAPVGHGLDFKVGVFDSIIGYESHDACNNPNYTRSYATTIEPHTHTGALMTYQFSDAVTASIGIANTFGPQINNEAWQNGKAESYKTYMAAVGLTAPQDWGFLGGSTLYLGVVNGFSGYQATGNGNMTHYYVGATIATPIKELRVGTSYDYANIHNGGYASVIAGYVSVQATEKLSFHARAEYLNHTTQDFGGAPNKAVEVTTTIQYDLWKNVVSRLEFRWDGAQDGSQPFGGRDYSPTGTPSKGNNFMVAANFIYKF